MSLFEKKNNEMKLSKTRVIQRQIICTFIDLFKKPVYVPNITIHSADTWKNCECIRLLRLLNIMKFLNCEWLNLFLLS